MEASLGDCNCLLFHDFVDGDSVSVVHLVKLIDTDDSTVGQNHSTSLEVSLAGVLIDGDGGSETDACRSTTRCVDSEGSDVHDVSQEL